MEDLTRELERHERAARRHTLWALLGVSPAALIPLLATASDLGAAALVAGMIGMTGVEFWRAVRARKDAERVRTQLDGHPLPGPSA